MSVLFVSDLHLDAGRPETIKRFVDFVAQHAFSAERLYILGDLFESWIGDDDTEPGFKTVIAALARLHAANVACFVMHGNRDFLIGERFASAAGCRLLDDYERVEVYGESVLLMHGDLLCTDDVAYMAFRATVRSAAWQREFLAKPLSERRAIAAALRARSASEMATKSDDIMDVNQTAVEGTMRHYGVRYLLHGHTHRPAIHRFSLDDQPAARIVLGAWHDRATIASWDTAGFRLETI
jgi:UDP-2,3-diacylglucosamine hydrolase